MKKWGHRNCIRCLLLAALLSLSACGREERQRGTDGYVYEAEQIANTAKWDTNIKYSNNWLYYIEPGSDLCRIALGEDGRPEETTGTRVPGTKGMLDYTVDAGGNIYCYSATANFSEDGTVELEGGTLTRYREDGTVDYSLSLEGWQAVYTALYGNPGYLAAGTGDKVFLQMGDLVLVVDGIGKIVSQADIRGIRSDNKQYGQEKLLEGEDGRVYCLVLGTEQQRMYELVEDGSICRPQAMSMKGLEGEDLSVGRFYGSQAGMMYSGGNGILYCYNIREEAWQELLRWSDSALGSAPSEVEMIPGDRLLASYQTFENGAFGNEVYLLDRKSVEELPEREELILACWNSCPEELEDAVIQFNRESEQYHVTIQLYQDEAWLDARLVSSDPPDMLRLLPLNVGKYGGKQVLEDMDPYLEESARLKREDFLEGPLAGYTINGKLVGIPTEFICGTLLMNASEAAFQAGWSLEDMMILTEKYPERKLSRRDFSWNLKNLCGEYIMDTFVDRESGECHFDTREFRSLVQWLGECSEEAKDTGTLAEVGNPLVYQGDIMNIFDFIRNISRTGENMVSVGYPSTEGRHGYQAWAYHAVGIVSKSRHKEGAWQFVEYFLSHLEADYRALSSMPTRRDLLEEVLENAMTPEYIMSGEEVSMDEEGNPRMMPKWTVRYWNLHGEYVEASYNYATQEEVDGLLELISQADFSPEDGLETAVMDIIAEEVGSYLDGSKPIEEVTKIIQSRVSTLVQENM